MFQITTKGFTMDFGAYETSPRLQRLVRCHPLPIATLKVFTLQNSLLRFRQRRSDSTTLVGTRVRT
jgi:hypothetical protein